MIRAACVGVSIFFSLTVLSPIAVSKNMAMQITLQALIAGITAGLAIYLW
jgi:hypothetical protein